jgi:hypothetical protein
LLPSILLHPFSPLSFILSSIPFHPSLPPSFLHPFFYPISSISPSILHPFFHPVSSIFSSILCPMFHPLSSFLPPIYFLLKLDLLYFSIAMMCLHIWIRGFFSFLFYFLTWFYVLPPTSFNRNQ